MHNSNPNHFGWHQESEYGMDIIFQNGQSWSLQLATVFVGTM